MDHFSSFYWICYNTVSILCLGDFFFFFFWSQGMWDLSSLARDWTHNSCNGRWSLNHWTTREVPFHFLTGTNTRINKNKLTFWVMKNGFEFWLSYWLDLWALVVSSEKIEYYQPLRVAKKWKTMSVKIHLKTLYKNYFSKLEFGHLMPVWSIKPPTKAKWGEVQCLRHFLGFIQVSGPVWGSGIKTACTRFRVCHLLPVRQFA